MTVYTLVESPIGELTIVGADGHVTGLYFPDHWGRPAYEKGTRDDAAFAVVAGELEEYFAGRRTVFDVPVRATGDAFERAVWAEIALVPHGSTTTYGEIAAALGDPSRAREVGAAVGRNPLSVLVPCHRVVGKGGKLTGYAGGLRRKRFLLDLEDWGQLW